MNTRKHNSRKTLLLLLPFWTPQIPPMGISCLKSFLSRHGYETRLVDANTRMKLREGYDLYFDRLKRWIPLDHQGNLSSVGNEVWQNHMMAHFNHAAGDEMREIVRILVNRTFFWEISDAQIGELDDIIEEFYRRLEVYLLEILEREKPTIVGISVFIGTLPASLFAFRLIKEKYPHILTVMGGGVFYDQLGLGTENLDFFLEKTRDYVDKVIIGEGEILFLKLLMGEFPESQRVFSIRDIGDELVDLNAAIVPDISDFDIEHYPYIGAYTSRSCPFQCHFCSDPVLWGKYRKKRPAQIVAELVGLHRKYGTQLFIMSDLLINPVVSDLAHEFIGSGQSIYWDAHLRVGKEVGNLENTMLWRRGGYYRAELGVESGSQRVLDLMDKRITVDQSRAALTALASAGIKTTTYWVIGYPRETEEDFCRTLSFLEEMQDDIYEGMPNPFWYYPSGQVNSSSWRKYRVPLYPEKFRDILILQHWILDIPPDRRERFQRLNRFVWKCRDLGIPDIFSLQDIYRADERWQRLHRNSVPPLVKFKEEGAHIDENRHIKTARKVHSSFTHDENWGF